MRAKRTAFGLSVILLTGLLGVAWIRGGDDYSDGDQAVADAARIKPGMTIAETMRILHPSRLSNGHGFSYRQYPIDSDTLESFHALTRNRYLALRTARKGMGDTISSWHLEEGRPPREDVTLGRSFEIGSMRFRY